MELPDLLSKRELYEQLGISEPKLDAVLVQLNITGQRMNSDGRKRYFTRDECARIQAWLAQPTPLPD